MESVILSQVFEVMLSGVPSGVVVLVGVLWIAHKLAMTGQLHEQRMSAFDEKIKELISFSHECKKDREEEESRLHGRITTLGEKIGYVKGRLNGGGQKEVG